MDGVVECFQREPLFRSEVVGVSRGRKGGITVEVRVVHQTRNILANHALRFPRAGVLGVFHWAAGNASEVFVDRAGSVADGL